MVSIKTVTNADSGTADIVGGDDWDAMSTIVNNNYPSAADFTVYIEGGIIKARNNALQTIPYNHATDLGNVLTSVHGALSATSGGTVKIKSGSYGWASQLAVTKPFVGLKFERGAIVTPTAAYATDMIKVDKNDFLISDGYFDMTNMSNGTGSWLVIASGSVNSDRPRVYRNRIRNAPTHCVYVASGFCNGLYLCDNYIQSTQAPTGHGLVMVGSSDGVIYGNQVGGYANATNGIGMMFNGCGACNVWGNEIFTNREGMRLYLPSNMNIHTNLIQNNQQHGLTIVNDTATDYSEVSIIGNRIHDNSTSSAGTYSGITFSCSSTGVIDRVACIGNVCTDPSVASKKQGYGISINTNKVTNSSFIGNTVSGNLTGGILRGTYDSTCRIFANPGDATPYSFEDFMEDRVLGSAPADPASGFNRRYSRTIDANNDAFCIKRKVNGAVVEVII